jgi:hypothetical protein
LRSLNCIYGHMVIYPAGLTQKLSWNKNAEIIQLDINSALLTQAYQDASRSHKLELIPQYGIRDTLFQQLLFTMMLYSLKIFQHQNSCSSLKIKTCSRLWLIKKRSLQFITWFLEITLKLNLSHLKHLLLFLLWV